MYLTKLRLFFCIVAVSSTVLIPRDQSVLAGAKTAGDKVASTDSKACTFLNSTSKQLFDLNKLSKTEGDDYSFEIPEDKDHKKRTFHLNICHSLNTAKKGLKDPSDVAISVDEGDTTKSLGKSSSTLTLHGDKLILNYELGDNCPGIDNRRRQTKIVFTCDRTTEIGVPTFVDDFDSCHYILEWKTSLACPVDSGSSGEGGASGWSVFIKVVGIIGLIYLFGGILYNRFAKGAQGLEQLPHFQFWYGIYDFVKDMSLILAAKAWDSFKSFRSRVSSRYQSVPRNDNHTLINDDDDDF